MISYDKQFLLSANTPIFFFFFYKYGLCQNEKLLKTFSLFCSRGAESERVSDAEDVGHAVPVV